jgi:predicted Zn-dependent protease with MMP-like domain
MEDPNSFDELVQWAYSTLPRKVRRLPDFPGIQVLDEPPPEVFAEMASKRKWRPGTELLGLYSGTLRTKRSFFELKYAPNLIFVFRGPILRYISRTNGDLRAQVKQTVWHEVAHWLGFETEEQVEALGL